MGDVDQEKFIKLLAADHMKKKREESQAMAGSETNLDFFRKSYLTTIVKLLDGSLTDPGLAYWGDSIALMGESDVVDIFYAIPAVASYMGQKMETLEYDMHKDNSSDFNFSLAYSMREVDEEHEDWESGANTPKKDSNSTITYEAMLPLGGTKEQPYFMKVAGTDEKSLRNVLDDYSKLLKGPE